MNIEYVGRNYKLDDQVRSFTEEKLGKIMKFLDEPIDVRVALEVEKHRQIADLHLTHRNGSLQATEETDNMYEALNLAVDKLEKQARRSRKKLVDRRRRSGRGGADDHSWPMEVVEKSSLQEGSARKIIKSSSLQIKPMTLEEAALQLEETKNDFLVFRDSTTDRINVLYKRRDANYGLIAPEL